MLLAVIKLTARNICYIRQLEQLWKLNYVVVFGGVSQEYQISFLQLH